jgi:methyl-accepting chemotaxis protein
MSRFSPNRNHPQHLVASIVALAEQSNTLSLEAAMQAARADADGRTAEVVDQVCRLAVGIGVAAGEIAWLVGELVSVSTDDSQLEEAGVAVAGMESCLRAVTQSIQGIADRGAPVEVVSAAEALRRVRNELTQLLPRLQREFC